MLYSAMRGEERGNEKKRRGEKTKRRKWEGEQEKNEKKGKDNSNISGESV